LERGKGFVVAPGRIVAPYSLFQSSTHAMVSPYQGGQELILTHYFAIDRINDLIILDAGSIEAEPLKLYIHPKIEGVKTFLPGRKKGNTLPVYTGKCMGEQLIQGNRLFYITNQIDPSNLGIPIFVSTGSVIGLGTFREVAHDRTFFAIPSTQIVALLKNEMSSSRALSSLSNPDEKRNSLIRKITLVTDFGNIVIRLYNETPVYRDNFIKLVEEKYYDSLLIHRVIRDFGIQTGAADTRYALADDPVGWKGPGYTLPAHFVKGVIHKRGAIGSPRKPDDRNNERRSDGSQFYIVTGRKYVDEELDKFEKEHGIKYTKEQREIYKTVGGSPHLDGAYTVFGEVVSGMEVADKIANVATHINYRPQKDIRLKKVVIDY
jgi:cyclophilin family peptidyl-prolyl cis-trans isomerase